MKQNATMYQVNKVSTGYKFWQQNFRNKLYNYVIFGGLPASLPSSELMYRIIKHGYAPVFKHIKYGDVTATGGLSGVDIYGNPTTFVYAQPILGQGTLTIGKDVAIITATKEFWHTRFTPEQIIDRYARMMADIDSTFNIAVVNARANKLYGGIDRTVRESLVSVVNSMREGEFDVVTEPSIINAIKEHETNPVLNVTDLITARDSIEKAFWEEFGVHYTARKTERFLKDELCGDSQILSAVQDGFLQSLKDGVARVNSVLGTNITVDINPVFLSMTEIGGRIENGGANNV